MMQKIWVFKNAGLFQVFTNQVTFVCKTNPGIRLLVPQTILLTDEMFTITFIHEDSIGHEIHKTFLPLK